MSRTEESPFAPTVKDVLTLLGSQLAGAAAVWLVLQVLSTLPLSNGLWRRSVLESLGVGVGVAMGAFLSALYDDRAQQGEFSGTYITNLAKYATPAQLIGFLPFVFYAQPELWRLTAGVDEAGLTLLHIGLLHSLIMLGLPLFTVFGLRLGSRQVADPPAEASTPPASWRRAAIKAAGLYALAVLVLTVMSFSLNGTQIVKSASVFVIGVWFALPEIMKGDAETPWLEYFPPHPFGIFILGGVAALLCAGWRTKRCGEFYLRDGLDCALFGFYFIVPMLFETNALVSWLIAAAALFLARWVPSRRHLETTSLS